MRQVRRAERPRPLTRLALVAVVVAGLTSGCSGSEDTTSPEPAPSDTPLGDVDLTGVVAARTSFCDALDPDSVATVLGAEPTQTDEYSSGQKASLAPGLEDVAHEYSCSFERGSGDKLRTARAWLFAQAATPAQARTWVKERRDDEGCRDAGELSFGDPGVVQSCEDGSRRRVTAAGLFGDGWLTCQSTAPAKSDEAELLERVQRWCAEVALTTTAP
jgi:hypothetical protein